MFTKYMFLLLTLRGIRPFKGNRILATIDARTALEEQNVGALMLPFARALSAFFLRPDAAESPSLDEALNMQLPCPFKPNMR
jgi:hypothetical protein